MKPVNLSYEEFPEAKKTAEGIQVIPFESYEKTSLKSIVYDEEENLKVLYISDQKVRPLILYVQGSAWRKQNLFTQVFELYEFSKNGYHIAIAEYRDTSRASFPNQAIDGKKALNYLVSHSEQYCIDPNNIYLWGDSSGANTVLTMAVTDGLEGFGLKMPKINAVVDFYGPTHIASMSDEPSTQDHVTENSPEGMLIGGKNVLENKELADKTIIMNYISKDKPLPPIAIFHGSKDRLVPFGQSVELYECLKKEEKETVFFKVDKSDHGGLYFWHPTTLNYVKAFLEAHKN